MQNISHNQDKEYPVSTIKLSEHLSIEFTIKEYNGKKYGDIRKYQFSKKYTGPTKKGMLLEYRTWVKVLELLKSLPNFSDADIGYEIIHKINNDIGVTINIESYDGKMYFQIQRYYYKTKKAGRGLAINYEIKDEFIANLSLLVNKLENKEYRNDNTEVDRGDTNLEGVSNDVSRYF